MNKRMEGDDGFTGAEPKGGTEFQEVVSGVTDARRRVPQVAGKQFRMLSEQREVSGGRKACGDEGRDWVMVVGRGNSRATTGGPTVPWARR